MKYNDFLLHFEKNVKVHKTPNLIGLVVGKFELVLPLAKFPVLNSIHEGVALSLDTIQSHKALIARLVYNRLLEVRFNFKNVRIRCVPKDVNYLLSVVESETEYTKSAKGVIYVDNQITYDDPTGDATLSLETTNLNVLQSLKDELSHLLPNLVSGVGSEFDKLETPDLAFLAASSSSSSAEKIGGLFTKRDLPLDKEPHGNKYDSISFSGHDAGSTTLELLHKRSSCRDYSGKPLEQKKL
ncbi:MAG: hypothetical protein KC478_12100, partial [Bacteriovoracaceae bacterium]|nr:hypothetical protein [Bacteriovoracaceae bacterium]